MTYFAPPAKHKKTKGIQAQKADKALPGSVHGHHAPVAVGAKPRHRQRPRADGAGGARKAPVRKPHAADVSALMDKQAALASEVLARERVASHRDAAQMRQPPGPVTDPPSGGPTAGGKTKDDVAGAGVERVYTHAQVPGLEGWAAQRSSGGEAHGTGQAAGYHEQPRLDHASQAAQQSGAGPLHHEQPYPPPPRFSQNSQAAAGPSEPGYASQDAAERHHGGSSGEGYAGSYVYSNAPPQGQDVAWRPRVTHPAPQDAPYAFAHSSHDGGPSDHQHNQYAAPLPRPSYDTQPARDHHQRSSCDPPSPQPPQLSAAPQFLGAGAYQRPEPPGARAQQQHGAAGSSGSSPGAQARSGEFMIGGVNEGRSSLPQRSGPFMGAMSQLRAGPSDLQREQAERVRAQLKRDLEEQIAEKQRREAARKTKEKEDELREEQRVRDYLAAQARASQDAVQGRRNEAMQYRRVSALGNPLAVNPPAPPQHAAHARASAATPPHAGGAGPTLPGATSLPTVHERTHSLNGRDDRGVARGASDVSERTSREPRRSPAGVRRSQGGSRSRESRRRNEREGGGRRGERGARGNRAMSPAQGGHVPGAFAQPDVVAVVPQLLEELQQEQRRMKGQFAEQMQVLVQIQSDAQLRQETTMVALQQMQAMMAQDLLTQKPSMLKQGGLPPPGTLGTSQEQLRQEPWLQQASPRSQVAAPAARDDRLHARSHLLPPGMNFIPDDPDAVQLNEAALRQFAPGALLEGESDADDGGAADRIVVAPVATASSPAKADSDRTRARARQGVNAARRGTTPLAKGQAPRHFGWGPPSQPDLEHRGATYDLAGELVLDLDARRSLSPPILASGSKVRGRHGSSSKKAAHT